MFYSEITKTKFGFKKAFFQKVQQSSYIQGRFIFRSMRYWKMQVHLTAAALKLQDKQTQSARESLSVRDFRASNSNAFQMAEIKAYLK